MSWQKTDLVRRLGDKRLPGERQPVFLALLDSSVTAEIGAESKAATFTRNSAQYGRTLSGIASHAIDVAAIETFADAAGNTVRGYLSEGERTQRIDYSSAFDAWTNAGAVIVPDDAAAPDGTQLADRVTVGAYGLKALFALAISGPALGPCAPSLWIKKATPEGTLRIVDPISGIGDWQIDLSLVGAGWERIIRSHAAVSAAGEFAYNAAGNSGLYIFSHTGSDLECLLWGAGLEDGAWESSSIATSGAPVVRAPTLLRYAGGRNVCDGSGPRTYICRFVCEPGRSGYLWSISDGGSAADRIYATIEPSTGRARVRTAISAGNTGDVTGTTSYADGEEHEAIVQLASDYLRLIVDGEEQGVDTSVAIPQNLDRWDVGASEQVDYHLNGNITRLQCSEGLVLA